MKAHDELKSFGFDNVYNLSDYMGVKPNTIRQWRYQDRSKYVRFLREASSKMLGEIPKGATHQLQTGMYYKYGLHNFLYYWNDAKKEWQKSDKKSISPTDAIRFKRLGGRNV